MTGQEYLEFLQISTGVAQPGIFHPSLDPEDLRSRYQDFIHKRHRSKWTKYEVGTPEELVAAIEGEIQDVLPHCSRYEDLGYMLSMSHLRASLDEALRDLDLGGFEDITIGTLPGTEMNGLTIRVAPDRQLCRRQIPLRSRNCNRCAGRVRSPAQGRVEPLEEVEIHAPVWRFDD